MSMVDTSSYPKPQAGPSALDTMQKLQGLEQQSIAIDQNKLKLVNDRYGVVSRELQGLMGDPDLDFNKVAGRFQNLVNLGLIPSKMMAQSLQDVPTDKTKIPGWLQMKIQQGQSIVDAVNYAYGAPQLQSQGQQLVPTRTSPKPGFGVRRADGDSLQIQAPPTTPMVGPEGQPTILGPQAEQPTPGMPLPVARPPGAPQAAARPATAPVNPSPLPVGNDMLPDGSGRSVGPNLSPNQQVQNRYPAPSGINTGMPPLFEEGKKQFANSQDVAAAKSTSLKPLVQAIPLIKGLTTGIGTETYNKALAGLNNLGWLPEGATGKVSDYQVINKKLADYLRTSPLAGRSDAAQALSQSASPDPKGQINQALMKLAKDAVALDRIQIAMPHAFEGQDFTQFGKHMSSFTNKVDEKAFNLDMLDDKERTKLLSDMDKKLNSKDARERSEGQKFRRSLAIVDKLKLFD